MRVLVTHGSKRGGTEGIAIMIAEAMRSEGVEVDVRPAGENGDPSGYDAVIIGGALYAQRWPRSVRRYVVRNARALQRVPVWMFSSGPLGDSAQHATALPPTAQVSALMARVAARGHATFGGRLEKEPDGFIARAMAKKLAGDWRDPDQIRAWARTVAREVMTSEHVVLAPVPERPFRGLAAAACLLAGLTAMAGGLALILGPDGSITNASPSLLEHSPFRDFLIPGLLLFGVVGLGNTIAALLLLRRHWLADRLAYVAGGALAIWIVAEMIMLRTFHLLQLAYLVLGLAIQLLTVVRSRRVPFGRPLVPSRAT